MINALKQSEFMCTACTHVYVCFPKDRYEEASPKLREYLLNKCNEMGVGVLLVSEGRVEEVLKPNAEKTRSRVKPENYYSVLAQFTGKLSKAERVRLVKALGLLGLSKWLEERSRKLGYYEERFGRKAAQFLAFDTIRYTLTLYLYADTARRAAERVLDLIVEEAGRRGLGPFELLATASDIDELLRGLTRGLLR